MDWLTGPIADLLRGLANALFGMEADMLQNLAGSNLLSKPFNLLLDSDTIYGFLYVVWQNIAVPLGIVVVCVFFVVGLYNVFKTVGQNESGIDIWQMFLCYFLLAGGVLVIQNSWALFEGAYDLVVNLIDSINYLSNNLSEYTAFWDEDGTKWYKYPNLAGSNTAFDPTVISDDVDDLGMLAFADILGVCGFAGGLVVYIVAYACLTIREIQLYIYTVAAPVPLAFLVSDSSRSMGTGFLKRYVSVLLSGVIILLLIIILGLYLGSAADLGGVIDNEMLAGDQGWFNVFAVHVQALLLPIAIAWAMLKSGQWAKELVGIGI